jgi:hypothetical protein
VNARHMPVFAQAPFDELNARGAAAPSNRNVERF